MPVALPPTRLSVLAAGLDAPERVGQSDDVLAKDTMPFIDEIDGILVYTCPPCRLALAELDSLQPGR
jgi:hypothetical protein